jgi:hypothetical protein
MDSRLKVKFLVSGALIAFGIYNMFWFFVYSPILHTPFPFEYVQIEYIAHIELNVDIGSMPLDEAYFHPYWLFWSLIMYFGIGYLSFLIIRLEKNYRNHVLKQSAKIVAIAVAAGFGLYAVVSFAVYSIVEVLPEPDPYLKAEFNGLDVYKSGQPIEFSVFLDGYGYTVSYLEMQIKNYEGRTMWSLDPYIPFDYSIDKNYSITRTIPIDQGGEPIIIFAPGEYVLEISVSGHTITKSFSIEI